MPYESLEDIPENLKVILPNKAQIIFYEAFNRAWYKLLLPEEKCFMYSWGAIKNAGYVKNPKTGKWHKPRKSKTEESYA